MPIGLLTLEIYIPEAHSLKDKRQVLRSLKDRLRGKFNVAVAELEGQDSWQRSVVGVVSLANNAGFLEQSLRTVLEESRAEQRNEIVANLAEGQVIDGVVKNITDYGAFVDLGGIDGLLHVTDVAWRRVNHPTEVLAIGQTVRVKIIKVNHETHRISLGMKQLLEDPWQGIEAKYPAGARFQGRVTNITDYGAFVELEPVLRRRDAEHVAGFERAARQ